MLHDKAAALAEICVNNKWIPVDERDWCVYAIEKWLLLTGFFMILFVWILISDSLFETVSFLVPFYVLRCRIGGFHAKKPSVCLAASTIIIVFATIYVGPFITGLKSWILLIICVSVNILGFFIKPVYPVQVKFSKDETQYNLVKKNRILAVELFVQVASIALNFHVVAVYTSMGTLVALLMVLLELSLRNS